jgi:hypothetical protein
MLRHIISFCLLWGTLPVQAFELGQTEAQVLSRYGPPNRRQASPEFRSLVYVRPFGQVIVLLGADSKTEAILQIDSGYGKDYPELVQFLSQQQPSTRLKNDTYAVDLFQQLSTRGFEAWLYKRKDNRTLYVLGDLLAVSYRRDEASSFLLEYGKRLLTDPKIQPLLK